MKILAFNGSPRMKRGNTEKILAPFLEGAKEAGAEVELIYVNEMNIQPCKGCFSCWFVTPGRCPVNDDINMLRHKFLESDMFLFATPIYMFSCPGYFKTVMERLLFPLTLPEYVLVDGRVFHPIRYPEQKWKCMIIANAAFDGDDVFRPLIDMYGRMIDNVVDREGNSSFISIGSIKIGFSELFADKIVKPGCMKLFEGLKRAGSELAKNGFISDETLSFINNPLYYFAGMTRQEGIDRNNKIIDEYTYKCQLLARLRQSDATIPNFREPGA